MGGMEVELSGLVAVWYTEYPMAQSIDAPLCDLLTELVTIDSVNPTLVPDGAGEAQIARHIVGWMQERGFEARLQDTGAPDRPNAVGVLRGTGGGRTLMLNGHIDTVGVAGMRDPHRPRVEDGRLYGRGAMDMKGGVAAMMHAAARAAQERPRGDVIVTAVVDEEHSSVGAEAALREYGADAAIVTEPTAMELTLWHRGFVWLEVEVDGVAAHGSRPNEGVDAIAKIGPILVGIDDLGRELAAGPAHPMLGTGSVHASLIAGGQELSSYAASCRLALERRTIPGEDAASALAEIEAIIAGAAASDPALDARAKVTFERRPLDADKDADVVVALGEAVREVTGREPSFASSAAWMDAALIADAGIPVVVIGPHGEGLHGEVEWVDLASVQQCSDAVLGAIRRFCG
jgi:acetylornithine deacetylase/succinyl-diaminopimelate desuccinylase family protein